MPIIKNLERRMYSLSDLDKAMDLVIGGRPTASGVGVTSNTAMNCVPYFAGVRLIAETVGQLPLFEYRRVPPRGKMRAEDRRLFPLMHDEPNPEMNAITFKEALQGHVLTWGNAFAEIEWDIDEGVPRALWPLRPDRMKVGRDLTTKKLKYVYRLPDGTDAELPAWRVWHLPGFGFDGIIGYDTIYLAREAIGMSLAMEEYGARFFSNGASPSGVLEHPNKLSNEAQKRMQKTWKRLYSGLTNAHRLMILEEGMKFTAIGIPPNNAQFLESRKFQLDEIARLLHIPPHMLANLDRATFSNIEHLSLEFVKYTMNPWLVRWEQTCNRKLLLSEERRVYFFEFLVDALLRADSAARSTFYRELFYLGALSPNDIREKENMNPIEDANADKYYIQVNMVPMEMAGNAALAKVPVEKKDFREQIYEDAVKRVAERERQNIMRAYRRDPGGFGEWLNDFYRDFRDYIERQVGSYVEDAGEFVDRWVESSRVWLSDYDMGRFEELDWVGLKVNDMRERLMVDGAASRQGGQPVAHTGIKIPKGDENAEAGGD